LSAASAQFVIAANHDPGCRREERRRRVEEIGLPTRPIVAMRAAGAAGAPGRTGADPVVIVAKVNDEIGPLGGGARGYRSERPGGRIAAILDRLSFEAAAGIADHDDPPHRRRQGP